MYHRKSVLVITHWCNPGHRCCIYCSACTAVKSLTPLRTSSLLSLNIMNRLIFQLVLQFTEFTCRGRTAVYWESLMQSSSEPELYSVSVLWLLCVSPLCSPDGRSARSLRRAAAARRSPGSASLCLQPPPETQTPVTKHVLPTIPVQIRQVVILLKRTTNCEMNLNCREKCQSANKPHCRTKQKQYTLYIYIYTVLNYIGKRSIFFYYILNKFTIYIFSLPFPKCLLKSNIKCFVNIRFNNK